MKGEFIIKIWTSYNNKEKRAKFRIFSYLLGLVLFNSIVVFTSVILFHNSKIAMCVGVIIVTVITVISAICMGTSYTRDDLLFLRDDQMALFVVDISKYVRNRRGVLGLYLMRRDKERILNNVISQKKFETYLVQEGSLHGLETEIECVESIKERRNGINIVCHVIYPNYKKARVSYFVKNGYEDQESLRVDLERRRLSYSDGRMVHKSHTKQLVLSSSLLVIDILLCVMSHPAVGMIDVVYYFYFLGAVLPAFSYFLYVVLTIRRGL